jgi:hypothetical protein
LLSAKNHQVPEFEQAFREACVVGERGFWRPNKQGLMFAATVFIVNDMQGKPKVLQSVRNKGKSAKLLAAERTQPRAWFFLSFASETAFLGGVIVAAHGILTATERATELGIHPGGDAMCWPVGRKYLHRIPVGLRNRLLTEAEVRERLGGKGASE